MEINKLFKTAIGKNVLANGIKVFVIFFHQILLVPLYIHFWGTDLYGDWIIVSAVSTIFSISDFGINTVTNNRFCIEYSKGNKVECQDLLRNNYFLLISVGVIVLSSVFILSLIFDFADVLGLTLMSNHEAVYISIFLLLKIFLDLIGYVPDAILNAHSMASVSTNFNTVVRFGYSIVILVGILLGWNIMVIVTVGLIPSIVAIILKLRITNPLFYVKVFFGYNYNLIKEVIKPSLAFMSFPIGFSILYQGFTIVINRYFGSDVLVQFNTTRTMINFIRNMGDIVIFGVKSELSIAYGKGDLVRMRRIHRKTILYSFLLTALSCLFIIIFGKYIYIEWTRGAIEFNLELALVMIFNTLLYNLWNSNSVILTSTNRHSKLSIVYLLMSVLSIVSAYLIGPIQSILLVAACLSITDISCLIYSGLTVRKYLMQ